MIKTRHHKHVRKRGALLFAAMAASTLSVATYAQNIPGSAISAPTYGIPPSANTIRALNDPPGVLEVLLSGFYASLGIAIAHTDNVNRVPESSELYASDTFTAFTPRLGYQTNIGRHQALVEYVGFSENYQDFTNLDATDHRIRGVIDFDFTEKLDGGIWAGWADVNERRGTSGAPVLQIEPNEVEITNLGADLRYGTRAARHMQVRFGVEGEDWRYQNNEQQFRDRDTNAAFGEIHYNVSDRTSVFLFADYREFEYTSVNATNSDSEETTVQLGAEWQATAKTRGRVQIGKADKDFKDPAVPDTDGTTYLARVSWNPKSYTTWSLYGSKRFEEGASVLSNSYVSTLWGIAVNHNFARRWQADAHFNFINDDFDTGREDEFYDFGFGVDYAFRWWMSVGARYNYIKRDSNVVVNNVAINDYDENVFGLTLQLNYQQQ